MIKIDKKGNIQVVICYMDMQSIQYAQSSLITAMQHLLSSGNPDEIYQDMAYSLSNILEALTFNGAQMETIGHLLDEALKKKDDRMEHFLTPETEQK